MLVLQSMVKKVIKTSIAFLANSVKFCYFICLVLFKSKLKNHISRQHTGKVAVLANGPSLKGVLPRLNTDEFQNVDFIVLNYFAESNEFWAIKPRHYCFADPMFYGPSHREEQVKNLFQLLAKVDWPMNLYVIAERCSDFLAFSKLKNESITLVPVNTQQYSGYPSFRNFFYKKGLSCPSLSTVAILAIYVAINSGYGHINLYGVDHTFFDSLCVDDNNRLCNRDKHFYDNGEAVLKPIIRNDNGKVFKISDYVFSIGNMFKSHDLLAAYADYMHVDVINCTPGSMIDSYKRFSVKNENDCVD